MSWDIHVPRLAALGYPINFSSKSGPVTRLAPNFNGISQYASIPPITVASGENYTISFYFSCQNQATFDVLGVSGSFLDFIVISPNEIQVRNTGSRLYFDGSFQDGNPHKAVISRQSGITTVTIDDQVLNERDSTVNDFGFTFDVVGSQALSSYALGFIWSLSFNDGSIYNFPMDDGWQNNPAMRNTGSGADGTFVNMTEAAWQEITL